ncbi:hypothetical protein K461DRAFT_6574 [Myriangium duriaei CBS 260.36]|uniref:Diphthamide biosynthesis protein 4 n=1 Tax=Myriangium duriaei CBS 260.36 TaxID=1168546 RepID=A0A9P4JBA5_9PEZI|nr:hypothetical protein K461DRAFT_6574 [Myriangium duriaei CBS 260.36]
MEDYYTVLDLTQRRADGTLTVADVRKAYHRALLLHHPDKSKESIYHGHQDSGGREIHGDRFTVDQITEAFNVLKDPSKRSEYDRNLALLRRSHLTAGGQADTKFFSGLDIVDLDDLQFDDNTQTWRRACRCGHEEGFFVTEDDLDANASHGELVTGCRGCSLWLKILFQLAPADDDDFEGGEPKDAGSTRLSPSL